MTFLIEVENKLKMARRGIHVRRKSWKDTLEEHRVNCPVYKKGKQERSATSLSLGAVAGEEDYLQISVEHPPVNLGPCKIELPSDVPFRFIPGGKESITVNMDIPGVEKGKTVTSLKIPSGPPTWRLEIMRTPEPGHGLIGRGDDSGGKINVTVSDDGPGGED